MRTTAPLYLLLSAYVLGCLFVGYMGWLGSALTENLDSEAIDQRNQAAVAAGAMLVVAIVMSVLLLRGRWRSALVAFVIQVAIGVFVLARGLEFSDQSDEWLYVIALGIVLTGAGALTVARPLAADFRGDQQPR